MRCLAILCVRNERFYVARSIDHLIEQDIEVVVIDNQSTDGTADIVRSYLGRGVHELRTLAFEGEYSLRRQLDAKAEVVRDFAPDWALHLDADELPQSVDPQLTLYGELAAAAGEGFTCVNFDEFVFVPAAGEDHQGDDYVRAMRRYYFFEPRPRRLMRAWRPDCGVAGLEDGGHHAGGPGLRVMPRNLPLRHYIVLGLAHARSKYLGRRFARDDVARGWHGNRMIISEANLRLPAAALKELDEPGSRNFARDDPKRLHFWQW